MFGVSVSTDVHELTDPDPVMLVTWGPHVSDLVKDLPADYCPGIALCECSADKDPVADQAAGLLIEYRPDRAEFGPGLGPSEIGSLRSQFSNELNDFFLQL